MNYEKFWQRLNGGENAEIKRKYNIILAFPPSKPNCNWLAITEAQFKVSQSQDEAAERWWFGVWAQMIESAYSKVSPVVLEQERLKLEAEKKAKTEAAAGKAARILQSNDPK